MVNSLKLNKSEWKAIEEKLNTVGIIETKAVPYGTTYTLIKDSSKIVVNVYPKDETYTIVIQGKKSNLQNEVATLFEKSLETKIKLSGLNKIGVDESGKGDLFGPLVIGGVYAKSDDIPKLVALGVKDSKKISDKKILELEPEINKICLIDTVSIGPSTYNKLYERLQNVNKILAWGHSRVIENLLQNKATECDQVVIDQFAKHKSRVGEALMEKGRKVEVLQMHKGESDVVVAAASIVARAMFLKSLEKLSKRFGITFPKGVSVLVKEVRKQFVKRFGENRLVEVSKLHFNLK